MEVTFINLNGTDGKLYTVNIAAIGCVIEFQEGSYIYFMNLGVPLILRVVETPAEVESLIVGSTDDDDIEERETVYRN